MRESLKVFIKESKTIFSRDISAVEVGVMAGENAMKIYNALCEVSTLKKLYLIDSWSIVYRPEMIERLKEVATKFDDKPEVCLIRDGSISASNLFKTGSIDYLYLDDSHSPDHVYKELAFWYSKISNGGMICGHDINPKHPERVELAVKKFCTVHDLKYKTAMNDNEDVGDWWIWNH